MNLVLLLDLSLRGSLILVAALVTDQVLAGKMTARWRRVWWLVVPFAFLLPVTFLPLWMSNYLSSTAGFGVNGIYTPTAHIPIPVNHDFDSPIASLWSVQWMKIPAGPLADAGFSWLGIIWLAGAIASSLGVLVPTWKTSRQWSSKRLSTDPELLNLLENAKSETGVTAPIGLVVSDQLSAPALLGWLRPRILLPTHMTIDSPRELRAVLLHELAHFKSLDIPLNWLFAAIRIVHWFNPLAWVATAGWTRFREEAADENAIRWMREPGGTAYGEILLKTLGKCTGASAPYGALAIGESIENLKRRMLMIHNYNSKSGRGWMASTVILTLVALMVLSPTVSGDDNQDSAKKDAVTAMQTWLGKMDGGNYAQTWTDASPSFQKAVPSEKWVALSTSVRTPLGKLVTRSLASTLYQNGINSPNAAPLKGTYVIAQFTTSFENLKFARETVTFEKVGDGSWRAAGYYIKPQ